MIGRQKIATVSGLLGALAVIYGGAAPAYADDDPKGECTITAQGDIVCIKKKETIRKDKRGYVVKQAQDCLIAERPRFTLHDGHMLNDDRSVHSGPVVECSNKAKLPKGFKTPKFKFKF
ncbi:hypothetical protein [Streptomyces bicolor]|uniref:hypothetical protein n=1 Tax=Streptomyces bicolor TaxID=66874 RepID=UPI0004E15597|nr:hypothetical protein [Streptomyces bicolor]